MFNNEFETEGSNRNILGMVGTGYMDNMMVLSKQALKHGFENGIDKKTLQFTNLFTLLIKQMGILKEFLLCC